LECKSQSLFCQWIMYRNICHSLTEIKLKLAFGIVMTWQYGRGYLSNAKGNISTLDPQQTKLGNCMTPPAFYKNPSPCQ
jgi:hypothetical protein